MTQAYKDLMAHRKQTIALGRIHGLLSWDQEVMMPKTGADNRAEQAGALTAVLHDRRTDPRIGDWLDTAESSASGGAEAANVRLIRRDYDRARKIPKRLAEESARVTAKAQMTWAEARENSAFADFAPTLARVIDLVREQAACLQDGGTLYDALIDDYEPGTTEAEIAATFDSLRTGLIDLRARITETGRQPAALQGTFPEDAQMALAREMAAAFGYDFASGRLDLSVHPFSSGTRGDSRITTRVDPANPLDCLYSTIHETGHALYEQGLDPDLDWQPAGKSVSMGVHESQSRFCENQVGRSLPFVEFLFPRMQAAFDGLGIASAQDLYGTINRVTPGFIRTEADEVHYNLHIMMRFDLERALISGDLQVADLDAVWNDRFEADFGVAVPDAARGVLQDVHWSCGLFGYFPTYALGNVYAGCLNQAMRAEIANVDDLIRAGDLAPIVAWLRHAIHRQGSLESPRQIITRAIGHAPDEGPLLAYLNAKFGALYGL